MDGLKVDVLLNDLEGGADQCHAHMWGLDGQLVSLLPPCRSWHLNSGCQNWWPILLYLYVALWMGSSAFTVICDVGHTQLGLVMKNLPISS